METIISIFQSILASVGSWIMILFALLMVVSVFIGLYHFLKLYYKYYYKPLTDPVEAEKMVGNIKNFFTK